MTRAKTMAENPSDLVGKEFIFEYGLDRILPPSEKTGGVFATEQRAYRRERVVRCRDCKFSTSMGYQCEWFHGDYLTHAQVVPEGFCAWGEPREGE